MRLIVADELLDWLTGGEEIIVKNETDKLLKIVSDHVKNMPSPWIQCSERMPEKEGGYLVTRGSGEDTYTTFLNWNKSEGWYVDCLRPVNVVAWMELPEPYKEANHE